jgi:hypothetical protein
MIAEANAASLLLLLLLLRLLLFWLYVLLQRASQYSRLSLTTLLGKRLIRVSVIHSS